MLSAARVIEEGRQAFRDGRYACPYKHPEGPTVVEGYHGARAIGPVRVGIDYRDMWHIGWNIEDLIQIKESKDGNVSTQPSSTTTNPA